MRISALICIFVSLLTGCKELDQGTQKKGAEYTVGAVYSILKQAGGKDQPPAQAPENKQVSAQTEPVSRPYSQNAHLSALVQGPFAGLTVIELNDPSAVSAIHPLTGGRGTHLVIFVSQEGTYAALMEPHAEHCLAWLPDSHSDPSTLDFGLADAGPWSKQEKVLVCRPFTIRFEGENAVRIISGTYNRKRPVIARIPLPSVDWNSPALDRHEVQGIRLGPTDRLTKGTIAGAPAVTVTRNQQHGLFRIFRAEFPTGPDQRIPKIVNGFVADQTLTGWSSDMLIQETFGESLGRPTTNELFDEAMFEKYGRPTRVEQGRPGQLDALFYLWLYDLKGNLLKDNDPGVQNCLGTVHLWWRDFSVYKVGEGMGPWGCSVVFMLSHQGVTKQGVTSYWVETTSAAAMTAVHFQKKLLQVNQLVPKIEAIQTYKPKL